MSRTDTPQATFELTSLTTSSGKNRKSISGRKLEFLRFPDTVFGQEGAGRYVVDGKIVSEFTFSGGIDGVFQAKQANNRPFLLTPILKENRPVGFVWTMPEHPKFEARFEKHLELEFLTDDLEKEFLRVDGRDSFNRRMMTVKFCEEMRGDDLSVPDSNLDMMSEVTVMLEPNGMSIMRSPTIRMDASIMKFDCTEMYSSHGAKVDTAGRYLEIQRLPGPVMPGRGRYINNGEEISVFTFRQGVNGSYVGEQTGGREFRLTPMRDNTGYLWTFPAQWPLFQAWFRKPDVTQTSTKVTLQIPEQNFLRQHSSVHQVMSSDEAKIRKKMKERKCPHALASSTQSGKKSGKKKGFLKKQTTAQSDNSKVSKFFEWQERFSRQMTEEGALDHSFSRQGTFHC